MNCIKDKCKYYKNHPFNEGYYDCEFGFSYPKDYDTDCVIDDVMEDIKQQLKDLRKYKKLVEKQQ